MIFSDDAFFELLANQYILFLTVVAVAQPHNF